MNRYSVAMVAAVMVIGATAPRAQHNAVTDAGNLSRWVDRETRTFYDLASRSTVRTLTLIPPGVTGGRSALTLVWHAYYSGRIARGRPQGVEIRAYAGAFVDTRTPRDTDIVFSLDEGMPLAIRLRYRGIGGFPGFVTPGGEIPISVAPQPVDELAALAWADRVGGTAIGLGFELRPDQVEALRVFVRSLAPTN